MEKNDLLYTGLPPWISLSWFLWIWTTCLPPNAFLYWTWVGKAAGCEKPNHPFLRITPCLPSEPAVLLSGAGLRDGPMGVWPVSLRRWSYFSSAAVVYLPQEVFGENSMHQFPGSLKLELPGPLPHTLAHGFQGTTQFVARFLPRPRQTSAWQRAWKQNIFRVLL